MLCPPARACRTSPCTRPLDCVHSSSHPSCKFSFIIGNNIIKFNPPQPACDANVLSDLLSCGCMSADHACCCPPAGAPLISHNPQDNPQLLDCCCEAPKGEEHIPGAPAVLSLAPEPATMPVAVHPITSAPVSRISASTDGTSHTAVEPIHAPAGDCNLGSNVRVKACKPVLTSSPAPIT